jgi:hypothetical protein
MAKRLSRPVGWAVVLSLVATLIAAPAGSRSALADDDCAPHCGGVHYSQQAVEIPGGMYLCFGIPCVYGMCCAVIVIPG